MKRLLSPLLGLIWMLFVICGAVVFTLNFKPLYEADVDRYQLVETTGYSREEIMDNYEAMIEYNQVWGPDTLEFPTFPMTEAARYHFVQVKHVFGLIEIGLPVFAILALVGTVHMKKQGRHTYKLWMGFFSIAIPSAIGIFVAVAWDTFFVVFHNIVFHNSYWLFDPAKDPVIDILPDGYFFHCMILIIGIVLAAAVGFILWYVIGQKKRKALSQKQEKI